MALQVMDDLPLALVGREVAAKLTGVLFVASLIGFFARFGLATRNGILMLSPYVDLMKEAGVTFSEEMILRRTWERVDLDPTQQAMLDT